MLDPACYLYEAGLLFRTSTFDRSLLQGFQNWLLIFSCLSYACVSTFKSGGIDSRDCSVNKSFKLKRHTFTIPRYSFFPFGLIRSRKFLNTPMKMSVTCTFTISPSAPTSPICAANFSWSGVPAIALGSSSPATRTKPCSSCAAPSPSRPSPASVHSAPA